MCGITGFLDTSQREHEARRLIHEMTDTITHRGPDGEGYWFDDRCGLAFGHRRLAIIDLSEAGDQPMTSSSGRFVVTYNGEIYNAPTLRRELESKGHRFRGHCDTEVLVEALDEWGVQGAVERITGMFALAIWDREDKLLHLVRDRFGKKPLYYGWQGPAFLFGSELKSIRRHPAFRGDIDQEALIQYLRFLYVPGPWSIYQGIHKVLPGTVVTVDPRRPNETESQAFWFPHEEFAKAQASPFTGSTEEAVDQLESLLSDAVSARMLADVPLGAFLSGGIDSSTIVALMQQHSARPVKTFTVGFHDPRYNEADEAKMVAHQLGTDHTEIYVTPEEAMHVIPRLPTMYDEPFADSSQIPTYLISEIARRDVTVALSGDGGDELFGGYTRYRIARSYQRYVRWMPAPARRLVAKAMLGVSPDRWDRTLLGLSRLVPRVKTVQSPGEKAHKAARLLQADPALLHLNLVSAWRQPNRLVRDVDEPRSILQDQDRWPDSVDIVSRMALLDAVTYLPDDILTKVDRASMATSLEVRAPFLDVEVAKLGWSLPPSMLLNGGSGKPLLKSLLARHLPRDLFARPKAGFGVPVGTWLRGSLKEWASDTLRSTDGGLNKDVIEQTWASHQSGRTDETHTLWAILMYQSWANDNSRSPA